MNRSANFFASFLFAAVALPFAALGAPDATTNDSDALQVAALTALTNEERCGAPTALTGLERRILEHASKGADDLRRFIWINRAIYQLDMVDAVDRIDQLGAAATHCTVANIATR